MFQYIEDFLLGSPQIEMSTEVKGSFKFHFEPSFKGQVPLHTLSIIISCFEDGEKQKPIEFTIKWCKIMDNEVYEIKDYAETYYHVNPSDIDLKIRAVVTSTNEKYSGTAFLTVGPILLDGAINEKNKKAALQKADENNFKNKPSS